MFTKEFLDIPIAKIADTIKEQGYYSFEGAVLPEHIDASISELPREIGFNTNDVRAVYSNDQYFFTHILAASQGFFDLITSKTFFDVSSSYLGGSFRLKCQRYYETYGRYKMRWHTDNKDNSENFTTIKGLIFIVYLQDTYDSQFQIVRNSHRWSAAQKKNDFSPSYLDKNYKDDLITFDGPKGTVVIYDTMCVHRGKPAKNKSYVRKSLFFQVDDDCDNGEKTIINSEFLPSSVSSNLAMYLGFNKRGNYPPHPQTSAIRLPTKVVLGSLYTLMKSPFYKAAYGIYNTVSEDHRMKLRKFIKTNKKLRKTIE